MGNIHEDTEAMKYVKSLRDAVKRRFAMSYLDWIRAGRLGRDPVVGGRDRRQEPAERE